MDDLGNFGRRSVVLMVGEGEVASAVAAGPPEFTPAVEKYEIEGKIGGGGMGEVLLVPVRASSEMRAYRVSKESSVRRHWARYSSDVVVSAGVGVDSCRVNSSGPTPQTGHSDGGASPVCSWPQTSHIQTVELVPDMVFSLSIARLRHGQKTFCLGAADRTLPGLSPG